MEGRWQFWIDVGGTFTDTLARRSDGTLARHKTLSSGRVKGALASGSTAERLLDSAREAEPPGFWNGCQLHILSPQGQVLESASIASSGPPQGRLQLATPLTTLYPPGTRYEIESGTEAPLLAIHQLLSIPLASPLPPCSVRLGTTRGTNALLTRSGARTALLITRGLGDLLLIGNQTRPKLFELAITKPPPLTGSVVEIEERLAADGTLLKAASPEAIRRQLEQLRAAGIESLAVCLLHAYLNPVHELLIGELAAEVGFEEISLSHRIAPLRKILPRAETTVVDAYLHPILRSYVARIGAAIAPAATGAEPDLRLMTSAGSLTPPDLFSGPDSILSGPAGGVVGFAKMAQAAGFERAIGFDMGGTSTDVARFEGHFEKEFETEKAGVRLMSPMLAIETVAAGGGSICAFEGTRLTVGPQSAGANPGPACYGRGGPLTITDMNFYLGKITSNSFPFPLDRPVVQQQLMAMVAEIHRLTGTCYTSEALAEGFLRVANAHMAAAIRAISVAKGYDPRIYPLAAFGGAAPQHACAVARELGMQQVLNHAEGGVLSAYGIGLADCQRHAVQGIYQTYSPALLSTLQGTFARLAEQVTEEVQAEGFETEQIELQRSVDLRYVGVDAPLNIAEPADGDWPAAYERQHCQVYGYAHAGRPLEVVAVRVEAIGQNRQHMPRAERMPMRESPSHETALVYFEGEQRRTCIYRRNELLGGERIAGPAMVLDDISTTLIDPHWQAEVLSGGMLLLTDQLGRTSEVLDTACDPILLEVFNNQFTAIASQMGVTLRNTASSVNVKERLDFSCAIFTSTGSLVVNAPHVPVHLGAMGETVRRVIADCSPLAPGDCIVTNDPYRGGSHLPDVTVITPVHNAEGELLFFTASRAHHAEIGGIMPGSMPPFSQNLAEEGVLIRNFKLLQAGVTRFEELGQLLTSAEYPSRNVADNLADIGAQVAANQQGARDLTHMVQHYSLPVVQAYMNHIQQAAAAKTGAALARLPSGTREFIEHLDDGTPLRVQITIADDQATLDFTGTGGVLAGNLNANRAIVTAAVLYCLRLLIAEDIPLNEGVLEPITLVLPECLLNPPERDTPRQCAAIVGGNVETSQRVVDCVLGALGLAAASQGTMNNTLFGNDHFGYYETVGGGAGATATAAGASAVHTHMTNTRLTDPEVLESRFPVRLHEFAIRRGSGGRGRHAGGDGIRRRIEFLQPLRLSLLTQRRGAFVPYGMAGGGSGVVGCNTLIRANGEYIQLDSLAQIDVSPGDTLLLENPRRRRLGRAIGQVGCVETRLS